MEKNQVAANNFPLQFKQILSCGEDRDDREILHIASLDFDFFLCGQGLMRQPIVSIGPLKNSQYSRQ